MKNETYARKLKSKYSDETIRNYSKCFYILGAILIILGFILLFVDIIITIILELIGLFMLRSAILYKKIGNNEISTERPNNCVTTIYNEEVIWKPTLYVNDYLEIDETNKQIAIFEKVLLSDYALVCILDYSDLLSYQLLENDKTITESQFGLGSMIWSDIVYGEEDGAIVGSNLATKESRTCATSLKLKINVKDISTGPIYINFFDGDLYTDGSSYEYFYNIAQQILSALESIKNEIDTDKTIVSKAPIGTADEIAKFKELATQGIITEQEFEDKKKQLLNI
ncbi:MAG: SHOCT domain-containing protein [Aminipila sp.]